MKVITIGRAAGKNDIVVRDSRVSHNHMQLVQDDQGNIKVVDMGSTNGTYVNGKRIKGEHMLSRHDTVRIGDTIIPWLNYFTPGSSMQTPMVIGKRSNAKLYIIIGVAAAVIAVACIIFATSKTTETKKTQSNEPTKTDNRVDADELSLPSSSDWNPDEALQEYDNKWKAKPAPQKPAKNSSKKTNQPKKEQPKTNQPKTDQPKTDQPKTDQPKTDQPKTDQPKSEQPKTEQPKTTQPKTEQPKTDQPKTDQPKSDKSKTDNNKASKNKKQGRNQSFLSQNHNLPREGVQINTVRNQSEKK